MGKRLLALPLISSFMRGRSSPLAGHSFRSHDLVPRTVATAIRDLPGHQPTYGDHPTEQGELRMPVASVGMSGLLARLVGRRMCVRVR